MLKALLTIVIIYIVCTAAYTGYRVLTKGESISEALRVASGWIVPAFGYLRRKVRGWWANRNTGA